jgi:hypothetical protein
LCLAGCGAGSGAQFLPAGRPRAGSKVASPAELVSRSFYPKLTMQRHAVAGDRGGDADTQVAPAQPPRQRKHASNGTQGAGKQREDPAGLAFRRGESEDDRDGGRLRSSAGLGFTEARWGDSSDSDSPPVPPIRAVSIAPAACMPSITWRHDLPRPTSILPRAPLPPARVHEPTSASGLTPLRCCRPRVSARLRRVWTASTAAAGLPHPAGGGVV